MPKFTKTDGNIAVGALIGIIVYKRFIRPVVQAV